jgi:molybdopterin-guanine dinucleotide biosynthesis protein B
MTFESLLTFAGPCDVILVEGYKREDYPKIEIRREGATSREPLSTEFPGVVAIASDRPQDEREPLPTFPIDDIEPIVSFIIELLGLRRP